MKILLDMNLSPEWIFFLKDHGVEAVHWSSIGDPRARDEEILSWARQHQFIVFTNDLDFGYLLALTASQGPSVLQVRGQSLLPDNLGPRVLQVLQQHQEVLDQGALVVFDQQSHRLRILPIHPR